MARLRRLHSHYLRGRNSGLAAGLQVILQTTSLFLVYRIVSQTAGIEAMGLWATNVAVMWMLSIADLGLTEIIVREASAAAGHSNWGRIKALCQSVTIIVALLTGVAGTFIAFLLATILAKDPQEWGSIQTIYLFAFGAAGTVWLNLLVACCNGLLESFGRYDIKVGASLLSGIGAVSVTAWASIHHPETAIAFGLLTAGAVNLIVVSLAVILIVGRLPGQVSKLKRAELLAMTRTGMQVRMAGLATAGLEPASRLMLLYFGGSTLAGYYELAYRFVVQIRTLLVSVTQVMVPRLSRDIAQGRNQIKETTNALTRGALQLSAILIWPTLMALPLLSAVILKRLQPEIPLYGLLLALAWTINFLVTPAYYANFVEGQLRVNRTAHLTMLVCTVILGLPAGLLLGGTGVVSACAVAICVGSLTVAFSRPDTLEQLRLRMLRTEMAEIVAGIAGCLVVGLIAHLPLERITVFTGIGIIAGLYLVFVGRKLLGLFRNYLHTLSP